MKMYKRYNYQLYMYNHLDIYKRIYNETFMSYSEV